MAEFWDFDKNPKGVSPADIALSSSTAKYWFKPQCGHPSFEMDPAHIRRGQWCPMCVRKTEAKVALHFEADLSLKLQKEWGPDWLINPDTNSRRKFDFLIQDLKTISEIDGLQHFIPGCWTSQKFKEERSEKACADLEVRILTDVKKMQSAILNGYSGFRLFQPTVLDDSFDWKPWIQRAVAIIASSSPKWLFPKNSLYNPHIKLCETMGVPFEVLE
jgi:hypothetical protein